MAIYEFEYIDIDLKNEDNILSGKCIQGDTLTFNFNIWDGSVVADLSNVTMLLKANKNNQGYEIRDTGITINGNIVKVKCPASITQYAGDLRLELCFMNTASGLQKSSFDILIKVKKSVIGNTDGTVPTVIMTQLEQLNTNLAQISGRVDEAKAINNTLTTTNNTANSTNSTLNATINSANTSITNVAGAKANLDSSIAIANDLKAELLNENSTINQHINNLDIHVTKAKKDNWDTNVLMTQQLLNLVDILMGNSTYLVTENSDNWVTETADTIIV